MRRSPEATSVIEARRHTTAEGEGPRAEAVRRLGITGEARPELDDIAARAAALTGTPIAAVTVLIGDAQHLVAKVGIDVDETPREVSFCTHATARRAPMVIRDAARDPFFAGNPLVEADGAGIRSYCGAPIVDDHGTIIAVLCIIDAQPRDFGDTELAVLEGLARTASCRLQGRPAAIAPALLTAPAVAIPVSGADHLPLERDPLDAWISRALPDDVALRNALVGRRRPWYRRRLGGAALATR